jgi:flavin reductase (DIM6/NTAB) family NADH-FMN oxidoreductase RutF
MSDASAFRLAGEVTPTSRAVVTALGAAKADAAAMSAAVAISEGINRFTS